jgi:hypothetical protein
MKTPFFLFLLLSFSLLALTSCIRLTGNAGVWKKSADDPAPTAYEAGFDTQQLVPQKDNANITV